MNAPNKRPHPFFEADAEWSRRLSTSQAGLLLAKSPGAMRKWITLRAKGADVLEVPNVLSARKIGGKWLVKLHRSVL
jgi:hypothetical protein